MIRPTKNVQMDLLFCFELTSCHDFGLHLDSDAGKCPEVDFLECETPKSVGLCSTRQFERS